MLAIVPDIREKLGGIVDSDSLRHELARIDPLPRLETEISRKAAAHVELRTLIETRLEVAERKDFDADGYTIEDTGDVLRRLAVLRKADGKLMRDGFKSKQDAAHYISTELVARSVA